MSAGKDREVSEAARGFERQTDQMQAQSEKLREEIDATRQDFRRKRNDPDVVGLPPEPEKLRELSAQHEKHSADAGAPPVEGSPTEAESGAASIVEDTMKLPGNPGDEGVHGEDPNETYEDGD